MQEKTHTPHTAAGPAECRYRRAFFLLMIAAALIMPIASLGFGITWDEWMQGHYGRLILRFLLSGGKNHDFMTFAETTYLYGGLFDTLTSLVYGVLFDSLPHFLQTDLKDTVRGISNQDIQFSGFYETRHFFNALFGAAAIFVTGLLAKELRSWRSAFLALLFMLLSPFFIGHSMNNPKDIPFAAAYVLTLYGLVRFVRQLPEIKRSTVFCLVAGPALALGARAGGLILFFYFFLFTGSEIFYRGKELQPKLLHILAMTGAMALAGYLLGLVCWPYGLMNPVVNPLKAFQTFSHFSGAESKILFEGRMVSNAQLPWYYIPKWIGMTAPLFVLAGLIPCAGMLSSVVKSTKTLRFYSIPLFGILFPLLSVMITRPVLYDGWRHLLFIYPPLVCLTAVAWDWLLDKVPSRVQKLVLILLVVLCMHPLSWMLRNFPHYTVYFNPLSGGLQAAHGRYQTDYWGNSLRGCAEWLGDYIKKNRPERLYLIHSHGNVMSTFPYLKRALGQNYIPYKQVPKDIRAIRKPDYAILMTKPFTSGELKQMGWPLPGTIYQSRADQTTLCLVVENPESIYAPAIPLNLDEKKI